MAEIETSKSLNPAKEFLTLSSPIVVIGGFTALSEINRWSHTPRTSDRRRALTPPAPGRTFAPPPPSAVNPTNLPSVRPASDPLFRGTTGDYFERYLLDTSCIHDVPLSMR